jgi:hypothetical protein
LTACILFALVGYLLYSGGVNLLDFSTGLALLLTGMVIAVLWWGFKPDITRWLKKKPIASISIVKTPSLFEHNKLKEVYSPIHSMIVRVNKEIPREDALQLTVGGFVKASLIDLNSISAVFSQHAHELSDKDLEMWLEIEKQIKAKNGFFLGKDVQRWFDELEAEYNRLTEHYRG